MKNWYGIEGISFIWNGEWADPEIEYKGHIFNSWDIENVFYEDWNDSGLDIPFEDYMMNEGESVKGYLDDCIQSNYRN